MKKELRNAQDEICFTLETDKENGWLHGCWYGHISHEQAKQGCLLYLEGLQRNPYSKILNDSRYHEDSFLDISEWMERVCMPPSVQAGLTCFAHLVPENQQERLGAVDFSKRAQGSFKVKVFDNEQEAVAWLQECR